MNGKTWFVGCAVCVCAFFSGSVVQAQYSIDWYSMDAGGGTSSGGGYTLTGTIGQPDSGKMSGGAFELTGGFLSIVAVVQTPGAPRLTVVRNGNQVVISWPDSSTGFVLEETARLSSPSSTTVWTGSSVIPMESDGRKEATITAPVGNRYFRLKKP